MKHLSAKKLKLLMNLWPPFWGSGIKVLVLDDEVDQIKEEAYDLIKSALQKQPERTGYFINLLLISRHLERLADHATNIAEEVIYMVEGEIVRHGNF